MAKDKGPLQISLDLPYREQISRLFIFRCLWVFVAMLPMIVWGMWISFIMFFHFLYMLILGKRHEGLWMRQVRFFKYVTRWNAYLHSLEDKRPDFIE